MSGRRPGRRAKGLPLAAGQRQLVDGSVILEPLAADRAPHDLHRLAHAKHRPLEPKAVPTLDDLGSAHAESEDEAVADSAASLIAIMAIRAGVRVPPA